MRAYEMIVALESLTNSGSQLGDTSDYGALLGDLAYPYLVSRWVVFQ